MIRKSTNKISQNITLLNIVSSIILQLASIFFGFFISRLTLKYFGSDVNGLISSLTQFLSYIALIEGGITGVVVASLYKPLVNHDYKKISSIIVTTKRFYRKIGLFFIIYSLTLAIIYPIVVKTQFSPTFIILMTLILSLNLLIQYVFSLTYKTLLAADKKIYVTSLTQSAIFILTTILSFILVLIFPNIHIFKLIGGLLFFIQPLVYGRYVKKHYKIDQTAPEDKNLLKSRWDGFAINIAAFIHFSTDATILTIFTNLATVSIYSVYSLVAFGIRSVINAISNAIMPTVGHAYAKENEHEIHEKMDIYEFVTLFTVFFLFTVAGFLITPFVMIYTHEIKDANYYQPIFGILILLSEAIYLIKNPHLNLAYSANKFKEITKPAFVEAILNIVLSIFFVRLFGLIGVAIGTIIAMLYRMAFHIKFTKNMIRNRHQSIFYKKLGIFTLATLLGIIICWLLIPLTKFKIDNWLVHAIIYSIIFFAIYTVISLIFFRKELRFFKKYLK